ncbi:MAG: YhcB family protein [Endozoicomonadaceae bacterium]|nr:YhcB family protein [Endozoicomonadaceae bacterium]
MEPNLFWMIGGLAFFTGLVTGIIVNHLMSGSHARNNRIQKQLNTAKTELNDYREKVADHFSTTAHLVNRMTKSYRDVHEHMATSANELCTDELTCQHLNDALLSINSLPSDSSNKKVSQTDVEPPKDYAPKRDPEENEYTDK